MENVEMYGISFYHSLAIGSIYSSTTLKMISKIGKNPLFIHRDSIGQMIGISLGFSIRTMPDQYPIPSLYIIGAGYTCATLTELFATPSLWKLACASGMKTISYTFMNALLLKQMNLENIGETYISLALMNTFGNSIGMYMGTKNHYSIGLGMYLTSLVWLRIKNDSSTKISSQYK